MESERLVTLSCASQRLRRSWQRTWRLVLTGDLDGVQDGRGRWFVAVQSLERFERREREGTTHAARVAST